MFTPENKGVIKIGYLSYNSVTFLYYIINCHFFLRYSEGEIRFNLMAIVSDRKMIYEQKIAELQRQLAEVCSHVFYVQSSSYSLRETIFFSFLPSFLFLKYRFNQVS